MRPLVQRLGYVALETANPAGVAEDAIAIAGARIVEQSDDRIILTSNTRNAELIVYKAESSALRRVGLEAVNEDAVDEIERRAREAGLQVLSTTPSLPSIKKSVTLATSEGIIFEAHTPVAAEQPLRYHGPGVHPKCLDHVNLSAADPKKWAEEMSAVFGLLLSERTTGYEISWMRAADGRHHTVAAVKSPGAGVHHISWEFNSFEDFKKLGDNLIPEGRRLVWGPGRHGAGDNLFLYFWDKGGFLIECIAEMEIIHDVNEPPRVVEPGEGLSNWKVVNQWGATPPIEWVEAFVPQSENR